MDEIYCDHLRKASSSRERSPRQHGFVRREPATTAANRRLARAKSDYANFSGKFALAANRGQLTG